MPSGTFGVPPSPGSYSFDEDAELEAEQELLFGEVPGPEGPQTDDEDDEYEDEAVSQGMAMGEQHVREQSGGPQLPAEMQVEWQQQYDPGRNSASKRARRAIPDEDSDDGGGLDSRVSAHDQHASRLQGGGAGSSAESVDGDTYDDDEDEEDDNGAVITRRGTVVDARCFRDYNVKIMGQGIAPKIPEFSHSASTWTSYADAKQIVQFMKPIRTLCWNLPVSVFARHGTRFRHWTTPQKNAIRASHIAAIISFCFTGTSKGFLSGQHEELQRANGEAEEDNEKDEKKGPSRVYRYAFMLPTDNNVTVPMFTIGYEELYDPTLTQVVAIRLWKFVWDKSHSDSELCRKLLDENRDTFLNAGSAHAQNSNRRKNLVAEQKQVRACSFNSLEHFAGMQYTNIHNESLWLTNLKSYSGQHNVHHNGRPFFVEKQLPNGLHNKRITSDPVFGGTHPLSPEYVFNARRKMALSAGLVDFNDEKIEVHPDFLETDKYWTDNDEFLLPDVSAKNGGFFFVSDSYITNVFDIALPRPIYGAASAGIRLLQLYNEVFEDEVRSAGGTNSALSDCFNNMMKNKDPQMVEMERLLAETVVTYDSVDVPDSLRKSDLRCYGEIATDSSYIIEPEQFCKTLQQETRLVISKLVQVWLKKREELHSEKSREIRELSCDASDDDDAMEDDDYHAEGMESLRKFDAETLNRHSLVMKDLICLHLGRLEEAFSSKMLRETIPSGYRAMYDGLQTELQNMPNQTASIAWAHDVSLRFGDMSSFAHTNLWLGEFWEKDTFVEGRDRRIMDEMFLHFFEQFGDVTFVLLLCGYKGNGKTLRTERAQAVFPDNWITMGGPASAKAGQNGQSDSTDGKNVVYDEMINDLTDDEGSDRLEYWKQIVLKREYTYNRTVAVKNPDGTETHRTMKLRTPHHETHLICTNYGMAFTKDRDPSDTKFAMIDRSIAHLVRSIGMHARSDNEFKLHIDKPEQKKKVTRFRIFVCLVGATKLAIKGVPDFQPNFALANKMFDYLDKDIIVNEYNLPRCTPRKSLKREGNLSTMCIMKAVSDVFIFKQTAVEYEAGKLDEDGNPQPFKMTMLYDVIRQLRATPELIFMAWSQSLDYNIGTAAHSMATMTALCEHFKLNIGDWFKRPSVDDSAGNAGVVGNATPGSPSSGYPRRTAQMTDDEWNTLQSQYTMRQSMRDSNKTFSELPQWMNIGGVPRAERLEMLTALERQRRATSLYRHTCTLDGNTDLEMRNPVEIIEKVMQKHGNPCDLNASDASLVAGDCLPVYSSAILATTVQTCTLYSLGSVVEWCKRDGFGAVRSEMGVPTVGARKEFTFSERKSQGPCKYNTAWLCMEVNNGLKAVVKDIVGKSTTCKIFDLPLNAFRDSMYLLTTRDNSRRCTEEPKLPFYMQKQAAFVDNDNQAVDDGSVGSIRMRGVQDIRGALLPADTQEKQRHPYAKVPNIKLQRQIDFAATNGRLPALMPLISNNVRDTAPLRIHHEGEKTYIELNTSAAQEHTKMLAEASIRCSMQPGLENLQEAFCGGAQGPDGLCVEGAPSGSDGEQKCTRMAYSFDMISIALTLDAMGRFYDPNRYEYVKMYNENFMGLMSKAFETDDLPHMCLRFVGYEDSANRRLLSVPVNDTRNKAFNEVEVGDEIESGEDFGVMHAHLQLSLGHEPSDDEIDRYLKARAGSRSMSGVKGDLMNMETHTEHTLTTMKERGMISGEDDVVFMHVQDDPYGLRSRVAEKAGQQINKIVEKHPDMEKARNSLPRDHDQLPEEKIQEYRNKEVVRTRAHLYKWIQLPPHLDDLRDFAPLNIPDVSNFTFQNMKKDEEKAQRAKERMLERRRQYDASSQFKDKKRMREKSVPGRKRADGPAVAGPSNGAVLSRRGVQDGRGKAPMRP